jgi:hypothetical protein
MDIWLLFMHFSFSLSFSLDKGWQKVGKKLAKS